MNRKFTFLISFLVVSLARFFPLSYIIGSFGSFFSASTIASALVGKYSSVWSLGLFFIAYKKTNFLMFLLNRSPLLFSAWDYKAPNLLVSVIIPLVSILLFIAHPLGFYAWPYAMYWFLPILIFLSKKESIFLKSLSSVFVAHAVGSIIFLHTHEMSPDSWIALMPVVAFERMIMAISLAGIDLLIQRVFQALSTHKKVLVKESI